MRHWLLWAPLLVFAGIVALVAMEMHQPSDRTVFSHMVGRDLPRFDLAPLLDDKPGINAALYRRGKPRLVNIFASWCVPCAAEAPQLADLAARGVPIDAVAVRDTPGDVRTFLNRWGDPYARLGSDPKGRVQLALGSSGVPETFVIDGQGKIVEQHVGPIREEDIPGILKALEDAR
ncbi:DsbE family thiol:disulfide interchange protein [Stakelama sp. CBK3Z-3]|uniref:DsbE family thiol:disulfide interchange protein n=1 Tax=Stakelama flava TaxID=2860338 RepID=A0ABS6XJB7_9SPHN|nr:DsbE family thiol:disulfide interchange protein [Stakelama flava]MBW4329550.1 DsbE family thiol:disulfide interchange protein [Stakelama flava]